jgi:xanthine dehydrogenase YagR molybdenum-binding subunit
MAEAAPQPKANMGQPAPRIDGFAKVTGEALFAADYPLPRLAHAYLVTSAISRGRIENLDDSEARRMPGVLGIMTPANTKVPGEFNFFGLGGDSMTSLKPLSSDEVTHDGQIIAMVIAENLEQAREAAYRVRVDYQAEPPSATLESPGTEILVGKRRARAIATYPLATLTARCAPLMCGSIPPIARPSSTTMRWSFIPPPARGTATGSPSTSRANG